MIILGIYFSGTGNTKHCVEQFIKSYDEKSQAFSIEDEDVLRQSAMHDTIVLGYPVYYSNIPKILSDFICANSECFRGKKIFIIATMSIFSGDGSGCAARLLEKCGAEILGGLHLKMPDNVGDEKVLKMTTEKKKELCRKTDDKIVSAVHNLKNGQATKDGLGTVSRLAGLFVQRLWFRSKASTYQQKPNINKEKCNGCGICTKVCPMYNLKIVDGKAQANKKCTLCYRCFSNCPNQSLTILGKKVYEQYLFERYNGKQGS